MTNTRRWRNRQGRTVYRPSSPATTASIAPSSIPYLSRADAAHRQRALYGTNVCPLLHVKLSQKNTIHGV